ncbi:MAG: hypothetical protein JWP97_1502 [Labilithrix sp.]|nr:hypothetical protein [Labilithrix sp.]
MLLAMSGRPLRTALSALGSVVLVGCIVAVDPALYGSTCRFEGEDTQCGACVVAHCQAEVDTCCRDASCEPTAVALDGCAARGDEGCGVLRADVDRFAVAKCITEACGEVCVTRAGTSVTSCKEPLLAPGAACACQVPTAASPANDVVCNGKAYPDALCCAPDGWPGAGLECTCRPLACSSTKDGCFCLLTNSVGDQSTCETSSCCSYHDQCSCEPRVCDVRETAVSSCSVTTVSCPEGQTRVASCSIRSP